MAETFDINPAAPHHLPSFITPPGETDVLMVIMGIFLAVAILMFGILFLRLHTLPERVAHKSQKIQFEIVAVLGLIALFTHMHIFWVAGLLLALIDLPDFGGMMSRIAGSVERIAGIKSGDGAAGIEPKEVREAISEVHNGDSDANRATLSPAASGFNAAGQKEAGHV
jgi:hypothetical protein